MILYKDPHGLVSRFRDLMILPVAFCARNGYDFFEVGVTTENVFPELCFFFPNEDGYYTVRGLLDTLFCKDVVCKPEYLRPEPQTLKHHLD